MERSFLPQLIFLNILLFHSTQNLGSNHCCIAFNFRFGYFSPNFDSTKLITYTESFCFLQFLTLGCCNRYIHKCINYTTELTRTAMSIMQHELIRNGLCLFLSLQFMGDSTIVTSDKSVNINFTVKEE